MPLYLIDENKNLVEVDSEDNIYHTIATQFHSDLNNADYYIEFVTQAQYNQLVEDEDLVANTYYFITDDETADDLNEALENLETRMDNAETRITTNETNIATNATNIAKIVAGTTRVAKSTNAINADSVNVEKKDLSVTIPSTTTKFAIATNLEYNDLSLLNNFLCIEDSVYGYSIHQFAYIENEASYILIGSDLKGLKITKELTDTTYHLYTLYGERLGAYTGSGTLTIKYLSWLNDNLR